MQGSQRQVKNLSIGKLNSNSSDSLPSDILNDMFEQESSKAQSGIFDSSRHYSVAQSKPVSHRVPRQSTALGIQIELKSIKDSLRRERETDGSSPQNEFSLSKMSA